MNIKIKHTKHKGFWYSVHAGEEFEAMYFNEYTYEIISNGKFQGLHVLKCDCSVLNNHNPLKIEKIYLGNGTFALIDECDKEMLEKHTWYQTKSGYATTNINGRTVSMHRLIMNCPNNLVVDHVDGHRLDNRRINLRICSQYQNIQSTLPRRGGTSKYKGVSYITKQKKWCSKICFTDKKGGKKTFCIGKYDDEEKAAFAYNVIAKEMRGIYTKLNDVEIPLEECRDLISKKSVKKFREALGLKLDFLNY